MSIPTRWPALINSKLLPRKVVSWDLAERIIRNQEIWRDKRSIVHRLPHHYKERYWKNALLEKTPVHYDPPTERYIWDDVRKVDLEVENNPVMVIYPPEAHVGLWGGEGVIKGYEIDEPKLTKKILPRNWTPIFKFPELKRQVLYSEVLNKYICCLVTERALNLIDQHFGLDSYLLEVPDIDMGSKLGWKVKREILKTLATIDPATGDKTQKMLLEKYKDLMIPLEEAEWIGYDLNDACKKLRDIEDDTPPVPLRNVFTDQLIKQLASDEKPPEVKKTKFGLGDFAKG